MNIPDEHPKSGLFSLNSANKVADIASFNMPRFHLHNDMLGLVTGIVNKVDNTIDAFIAPFLTSKLALRYVYHLPQREYRTRQPSLLLLIILPNVSSG